MNNEIEQENLSSGASCSIRKPIKPNDLNTVPKHALDHKINDGSKKIQDDTDGSKKIQEKTSSSDPCDGDSSSQATQKLKVKWKAALEDHFNRAIQHFGVHKATPSKILKFMNLKFLTRSHVASKLQKYRRNLERDMEESMRNARIPIYPNFSSARSYINPQHSYNYNTRLSNNNLFNVQPGYGLGQSIPMMNNNAGLHNSLNYMNRRPAYDLSQTGSKMLPRRGNLGFQNGMLPLKEQWRSIPGTSQAPRFGQYGTTSNVLGMNYNPTTGSNYSGIRRAENGDLVGLGGIRVNGNGNDSFSGVRVHGTGSGPLQGMSIHGNGHGYLGGIRGYGPGNGSLEGVIVHGNSNDSLGGRRVHGTGTDSVGGVNVHGTGNGNGSLGENFGMNWNINNNNMSNHGSSTPMFPSALSPFLGNKNRSQNNLIAQAGGVIPALENPKIFNDYHDINEVFPDTNNSQIHQNQHQGNLTGENAYPLEDINSWSFNDISHGTNNEEILNSLAANPEMYFPSQNMNITNQSNNNEENYEEILNSLAANPEMYFPIEEMDNTNQEHGVADLTQLPLPLDKDCDDEDFINYLLDPDMN